METLTDLSFGEVPKGMHAMAVMGKEGDTKYIWDASKPDEVEVAKATFEKFVKEKKYMAFKVKGAKGEKGDQVREFDANEERYIFVPQMQGG